MDKIWSVTEFNQSIKMILENDSLLKNITLIGEVSDLKIHNGSGHAYLTLKDETSMIKAMMWKFNNTKLLALNPKDGMKIKVIGSITHYVAGGSIGFVINDVMLDGEGEAKKNFEELKNKYFQLGWFDSKNKKEINLYPQNIAIITAQEGDAIHDIIQNIQKKNKNVKLFLFPALVQGDGSAENIALQIKRVNNFSIKFDTIILGRGGGSYEHLAAFNEPIVIEAIHNSTIPIVTGIGHDKDETIACFVSDHNASTPTAAGAESVANIENMIQNLYAIKENVIALLNKKIFETKVTLKNVTGFFSTQMIRKLGEEKAVIDLLKVKSLNHVSNILEKNKSILNHILIENKNRLSNKLTNIKSNLSMINQIVDAHDIGNNFKKGYSVLFKDNISIKSINEIKINDNLKATVSDGSFMVKVLEIN